MKKQKEKGRKILIWKDLDMERFGYGKILIWKDFDMERF